MTAKTINVLYVGKKTDGETAFSELTRIERWFPGDVFPIEHAVAVRMLQHADVFADNDQLRWDPVASSTATTTANPAAATPVEVEGVEHLNSLPAGTVIYLPDGRTATINMDPTAPIVPVAVTATGQVVEPSGTGNTDPAPGTTGDASLGGGDPNVFNQDSDNAGSSVAQRFANFTGDGLLDDDAGAARAVQETVVQGAGDTNAMTLSPGTTVTAPAPAPVATPAPTAAPKPAAKTTAAKKASK
jgi:hypothetical protein